MGAGGGNASSAARWLFSRPGGAMSAADGGPPIEQPKEMTDAVRAMQFVLAGIVVLMVASAAMIFDFYSQRSAARRSAPLRPGRPGASRSQAAFRGQPSAVFFGFTHCPEVCPTTLFELDGWLKKLGDDGKNIAPILSRSILARHATS